MIKDHTWRPDPQGGKTAYQPYYQRPCAYMNCMKGRAEHERAFRGKEHLRKS